MGKRDFASPWFRNPFDEFPLKGILEGIEFHPLRPDDSRHLERSSKRNSRIHPRHRREPNPFADGLLPRFHYDPNPSTSADARLKNSNETLLNCNVEIVDKPTFPCTDSHRATVQFPISSPII